MLVAHMTALYDNAKKRESKDCAAWALSDDGMKKAGKKGGGLVKCGTAAVRLAMCALFTGRAGQLGVCGQGLEPVQEEGQEAEGGVAEGEGGEAGAE